MFNCKKGQNIAFFTLMNKQRSLQRNSRFHKLFS